MYSWHQDEFTCTVSNSIMGSLFVAQVSVGLKMVTWEYCGSKEEAIQTCNRIMELAKKLATPKEGVMLHA